MQIGIDVGATKIESVILNNNGEEISFLDASGKVILNFAYNDNDSWPALPDNEGYSLSFNNT